MIDEPNEHLDIVVRFNEAINDRSADDLAAIMAPDHRFIDSAGTQVTGREQMRQGWQGFFDQWPDYRNEFRKAFRSGDRIIILGMSHCSDPALDGPALWTARVENGLVSEWRVWEDTPENRSSVGLDRAEPLSMHTG